MGRFFFGMICGALLLYTSMHYHLIRSERGFHLVPKFSQDFSHIYTDIRGFTIEDWRHHKPVAASLMRNDQGELVGGTAADQFRGAVRDAIDQWFE